MSDGLGLLQTVALSKLSHRCHRYNMLYHDAFRFTAPHGEHQCIVTELLGFSLDYVRKLREYRVMQPSTVKCVARQILMTLEYPHEECGIIHAGRATF